jgi:hypothetical protein
MPARATDRPILLRRFDGTNRQVDSVYLGPSYLRRATNWVPARSFALTKRGGTLPYQTVTPAGRLDALLRAYSSDGQHRYLYAVRVPGATTDDLVVSVDDGPFVVVTGGTFAATGARYDLVQVGDVVYVGNGIDPLKRIPLGGTATNLAALGSFTDGSAAPTFAADANAPLLSGTYSYGWAVMNHDTGAWVTRGQAREVTKASAGDEHITFPAPTGYTLAAGERFHIFVAPVNLPIELAMDQMPEGGSGGGTPHPQAILRSIQAGPVFWPLRGTARTGRMLVAHRGRIWFAGWQSDRSAVMATNLILPSREQPIFSSAEFFPVNAHIRLPAPVTGLGIAAISENDAPDSPLVIFTTTRSFLLYGDILDDESSRLVEMSSRIGCVSHATVVPTPFGLFWLGAESVYQMQPGGGAPLDVGWPMAPEIRAIPAMRRQWATATFHKGFYKIAFSSPGSTVNDQAWWLDCRLGGVGTTPRWWGPHTTVNPSAFAVGLVDPDEVDRGFVAMGGGGVVLLDDQAGSQRDNGLPIVATLETGTLDDGAPFDKKLLSRVRVTAHAPVHTTLNTTLTTTPGRTTPLVPIVVTGASGGAQWNVGRWNQARWGAVQPGFDEGQTTCPADRPATLWAAITLQHAAPLPIALREVELRYHPVERPVRTPDAMPRA